MEHQDCGEPLAEAFEFSLISLYTDVALSLTMRFHPSATSPMHPRAALSYAFQRSGLIALVLVWLIAMMPSRADELSIKAVQVADDVWFVQGEAALGSAANRNFISNAGFVVTEEGVVVVDALGSPQLAIELIAEIRRVTPKPIRYVIVTHFHADHIYGLQAFKAIGATIIAHPAGREYLNSDTARRRLEASRVRADLKLAGVKLACTTNKELRHAKRVLKATRLDGYFDLVIGGDSLPEKKPHPSVLRHVAEQLGVPIVRCAHLGDSAVDVAAARNAGMAAWAVPYGYNAGAPIEASKPDRLFQSLQQVAEHVLAGHRRAA
jgi:phosphoglycolate phosphatase-like HAD superfamily hydrolase